MPPDIRNLRRSVVAGAALLIFVVLAYLGVARFRGHGLHLDLPGRLGVDISQTANAFTYSQSSQGHTLFTIHASKFVQLKVNQAQLHDVTITLYGPPGSGHTDKISGSDFTYDRKSGIVTANGSVTIDFASPAMKPGAPDAQDPSTQATKAPNSATSPAPPASAADNIHVVTSGVTFNQTTGEATTSKPVQFAFTRATGSSVGADYNSKTGLLILDHQVSLVTNGAATGGGEDAVIHAEHAQLMRENHQTFLLKADATFGSQHSTSDQATITFRPDGSAEHIDARGHVVLTTADGAQVHSSVGLIDLNEKSQPQLANLLGGVTYLSQQHDETMQGTSTEGTLTFASSPLPAAKLKPGIPPGTEQVLHHAQFRNAVHFTILRKSLPGDPAGSATRDMRASKVDVDFAPGEGNKALAQRALGVGGAEVRLHDLPSTGPAKTTTVSGDELLATIQDGHELRVLDGKGSTKLTDISPDRAVNTSTGDTLHMTFVTNAGTPVQPAPSSPVQNAGSAAGHADATSQVDTAVQVGNVAMVQTPAPGAKNADGSTPSALHATANRAEYHAADQVLHLTGDPHLRNDTLTIMADAVDYHRDSGDAAARGNVKSTYMQQAQNGSAPTLGGDGPVHVTADHALMTRSTNVSIFYGTRAVLARMWQGGDAVAAPVLELGRDQGTLDAHGAADDYGPVVHATLGAKSNPEKSGPEKSSPDKKPTGENSSPSRVTSVSLHYSDKTRRADFHGAVTAIQPSGTVHSEDAQVFLTPAAPGQSSQLDHMVAVGHVVITQPGRRGTGDRLVYTASNEQYLLTGSPGQPPRASDAEKGTTTGAALIFRGTNDSVEVADHVDGAPSEHPTRTVTDTRSPH